MPEVSNYTDEKEWMSACVPKMLDEGKDQDQAVAACMAMWERKSADIDSLKVGARNSRADAERLQMIHDYARDNGAACATDAEGKSVSDTIISFGSEVKALGDGKVGGYLVRYSDANSPDLAGDFFTPETDFGGASRSDVYYQHGLDTKIGKRKIGDANLRFDNVGAWVEAQLNMRDEYEKAIYSMAQKGKLGWSSGTAAHLVERQPEGKAQRIVRWPLGLDASLTPTPAEPRNSVIPLKSYQPEQIEITVEAEAAQENRAGTEIKSAPDKNTYTLETTIMDTDNKPQDATPPAPEVKDYSADIKSIKDELAVVTSALKREKPEAKGFAINTTGLGDTETKAFCHFLRTGQSNGSLKASNAVDMQEGTTAEGLELVPTGHYQGIIARRNESMIASKVGVRPIPGKGLTVNIPTDNEADGEFVATNEEATTDKDIPATSKATSTLVKYTKRMLLSWELLEDEDSKLMAFLDDWVGRGMAKTHNQLLVTAAASGTALKTFASATAIAVGEIEPIVYNSNVTYYLDDSNSNAWIMRPSTYDSISRLGSSSVRYYAEPQQGSNVAKLAPTLLGYPVYFSEKAAAVAASAKPVYFGNWNFIGYREAPGFTVLRDPYSNAATGQVTLHYYFRCAYTVLQAAAVGYGVHPSA